jgi:hypothetical protein
VGRLYYSALFQIFFNGSNLNWSEGGFLLSENFKIKYGRVDNEIRNKFPYRSFSKFETEFELKNQRTKLNQIQLISNSRDLEASEFDGIWHVAMKSNLEHFTS